MVRRSISFETSPIPTNTATMTATRLMEAKPRSLTILACSPSVRVPNSTEAPIRRTAKNTRLYKILSRIVSRNVFPATAKTLSISPPTHTLFDKYLFERPFVRQNRHELPSRLTYRRQRVFQDILSGKNDETSISSL